MKKVIISIVIFILISVAAVLTFLCYPMQTASADSDSPTPNETKESKVDTLFDNINWAVVGPIALFLLILIGFGLDEFIEIQKKAKRMKIKRELFHARWFTLLTIWTIGLQTATIVAIATGQNLGDSLVSFLVFLAITYAPFFVYFRAVTEDGAEYIGIGDWIIMLICFPFFVLAIVLYLIGVIVTSEDEGGSCSTNYHINKGYDSDYITDDAGDWVTDVAYMDSDRTAIGTDGNTYDIED